MKKEEFLAQLREALQDHLSGNAVRENVEYYNQYITEEILKGKKEEDVLQMLGDPWILARTVIDAYDGTDRETVYESEGSSYSSGGNNSYRKGRPAEPLSGGWPWWRKFLLILFVVMVLLLVGAVISGVIRLFAPLVVPLLVIMLIVRIFGGRRS